MDCHRVWLIVLILFPYQSFTQQFDPQFKFKHISLEEGLPQASVYAMLQDSIGYMWIATRGGLSKYDGFSFTNYLGDPHSVFGKKIMCLANGKQEGGDFYFGTERNGIGKYLQKKDTLVLLGKDSTKKVLSRMVVRSILPVKKNHLFFVSDSGLFEFEAIKGLTQLSKGNYYDLCWGAPNHLWYGGKSGILLYDLAQNIQTPIARLNKLNLSVSHLQKDPSTGENLIWGASDLGLFSISQSYPYAYTFHSPKLDQPSVKELWISEDHIWTTSSHYGLIQYTPSNGTFRIYPNQRCAPMGLGYVWFESLYEDRDGILWVGTYQGIRLWDGNRPLFETPFQTNCNPPTLKGIRSIWVDSLNHVWVGGEDSSIYEVDPNWKVCKYNYMQYSSELGAITWISPSPSKSDELWLSSSKGILFFNRSTLEFEYSKFSSHTFKDLNHSLSSSLPLPLLRTQLSHPSGNVWIGTQNQGLFIWDRNTNRIVSPNETKKLDIRHLGYDSRNPSWIWIGTETGLWLVKPNSNQKNKVQLETYKDFFPEAKILEKIPVIHTYSTDTSLWIATRYFGLIELNFHRCTSRIHLVDHSPEFQTIYAIASEKAHFLWLSTNSGIIRYDILKNQLRKFTVFDGLPSNEFQSGVVHTDTEGKFYFGSISGYVSFHPDSIRMQEKYAAPSFTKFLVNGKNYLNIIRAHSGKGSYFELPYNKNSLQISISNFQFQNPANLPFFFELWGPGIDSLKVSDKKINLAGLAPGTYRLSYGVGQGIQRVQKELKLRIKPPFWQSNSIKILSLLTFFATLVFFWRYEQNRREK
ncbi:MAG: two-component regulator propeller domain-containing protein, partial [Bacteroidota bacterium]